jgi:hypothetical protein
MPTTGRGYVYPASTEHDRVYEHIQNLAASVDTDISALTSAWSTYTPVWTSAGTAPSLGNGTITGRYKQVGKLVTVTIKIVFGSTTTFGTSGYFFSLPVTATGSADFVGSAFLRDTSAGGGGYYNGICNISAGGTTLTAYEGSGHAQLAATNPVVWANTDFFEFTITYEAA